MNLQITDTKLTKADTEFNQEDLKKIEQHFHELLFQTAKNYKLDKYRDQWDELPQITNDLMKEEPKYFAIPGMYGGFAYVLYERNKKPVLITNSWTRICSGSGEEHEITADDVKLVSRFDA